MAINISLIALSFLLTIGALILRFSTWFQFEVSPGWTTLVFLMVFGYLAITSMVIFSLALSLITARSAAALSPSQLMHAYLSDVVTVASFAERTTNIDASSERVV